MILVYRNDRISWEALVPRLLVGMICRTYIPEVCNQLLSSLVLKKLKFEAILVALEPLQVLPLVLLSREWNHLEQVKYKYLSTYTTRCQSNCQG